MRVTLPHAVLLIATLAAGSPVSAQAPTRMMGAPYHNASRAFIDLMIPHHEMALMMAQHAAQGARSDGVKALANRMIAEQTKEIADLKAARRTLFGSDSSRGQMMRMMMQMMGMQHMGDTAARRAMMDSMRAMGQMGQMPPGHQMPAQPPGQMKQMPMPMNMGMDTTMMRDFDRMFLTHMIAHHQDGIDMAILAEDSQAAARVKQLARTIREGQEREIAEMRRVLGTLPAMQSAPHEH